LAALLDALDVDEVEFRPTRPAVRFANDDELIRAAWLRADRLAGEQLRRPRRTRTTISTRSSS
jgi:hypothetical protein